MSRIKRVAGTSSGAMTAALVAVGYDSYDLEKIFKVDFNALMNGESAVCAKRIRMRNDLGCIHHSVGM